MKKGKHKYLFIIIMVGFSAFTSSTNNLKKVESTEDMNIKSEKATFGGGCFWCLEAVFNRVDGVMKVESGYAGGTTNNPTYQEICTGETGHAEVIQIEFRPGLTSYEELLDIFWVVHDPTTLNRQGADVGTQYRSIILTHDEDQEVIANSSKKLLENKGIYKNSIVTEILTMKEYFPAEKYHQDYFRDNKSAGYCRLVISPKIKKLQEKEIIGKKIGD